MRGPSWWTLQHYEALLEFWEETIQQRPIHTWTFMKKSVKPRCAMYYQECTDYINRKCGTNYSVPAIEAKNNLLLIGRTYEYMSKETLAALIPRIVKLHTQLDALRDEGRTLLKQGKLVLRGMVYHYVGGAVAPTTTTEDAGITVPPTTTTETKYDVTLSHITVDQLKVLVDKLGTKTSYKDTIIYRRMNDDE